HRQHLLGTYRAPPYHGRGRLDTAARTVPPAMDQPTVGTARPECRLEQDAGEGGAPVIGEDGAEVCLQRLRQALHGAGRLGIADLGMKDAQPVRGPQRLWNT